jgi:hypothetical protein
MKRIEGYMITNYKYCLLFIFVLWSGMLFGQSYCERYGQECAFAASFYETHRTDFKQAAECTGLSSSFLFGIVAPELTQYGYLKDKLETYSLKVLYVQNGKSYADFSIGCFQMKPSFVERLEECASTDSLLNRKYASCLFSVPEARASRVERIDRLGTVEWQITYLVLFCEVISRKFGKLIFSNEAEKLRFYASAYNCGFHKSEQQIKETAQKSLFPHFSSVKYHYDDIALWFYKTIETHIND